MSSNQHRSRVRPGSRTSNSPSGSDYGSSYSGENQERSQSSPKVKILQPRVSSELLDVSRKYSINTFVVTRIKGMSISGFDLEFNDEKIMYGKYNSSFFGDSSVTIRDNNDDIIAQLQILKKNTEFVCNVDGDNVFTCKVIRPGNNSSISRRWTCYIYNGQNNKTQ